MKMRRYDREKFEGTATTFTPMYSYRHPVTGETIRCANEYQARQGLRAACEAMRATATAVAAAPKR